MAGLRSTELHVLLALAKGPMHGYALVRRIEDDSDGRLKILPGNLYAVLRRIVAARLVRECRRPPSPGEDRRRRYFELTAAGRAALRRESDHLERLLGRLRTASLRPARGEGRS